MSCLYEISTSYRQFLDLVESGEIPDDAIADTLAGLDGEFEDKADNIACYIKSLRAEAEAIKAEEDALKVRRDMKEHKAKALSDTLLQQMQLLGKSKIETSRNLLKIGKNPPSVKFENEISFLAWAVSNNEDLIRQKPPEINKAAVKDLLKSGVELPGAELAGGERLTIK